MKYLINIFLAFICVSCGTTNFKGYGDLYGIVLDENSIPVEECLVSCSKNGFLVGNDLTNENGAFIFNNITAGKYKISGEKENYSYLEDTTVDFYSRSKVFCFQISSADEVFNQCDKYIQSGNYEKAEKKLHSLKRNKTSNVDDVADAYKIYIACLSGKRKSVNSEKKHLEKLKNIDYSEFILKIKELENEIYENDKK